MTDDEWKSSGLGRAGWKLEPIKPQSTPTVDNRCRNCPHPVWLHTFEKCYAVDIVTGLECRCSGYSGGLS